MPNSSAFAKTQLASTILFAAAITCCGCHDGPLYAIKAANPYFSMHEWRKDEELGVTDHQRRAELQKLASKIGRLPEERQRFWAAHLHQIMLKDESPEMRRLSVNAAGKLTASDPMQIIDLALEDDSVKVRMEACRALGRQTSSEAASLLAKTVGSDSDEDVRQAAIAALAHHKGSVPLQTLRTALQDRNPATRHLVMDALRDVTGKDIGNDPEEWIAALQTQPSSPGPQTQLVNAELENSP